MKTLNCPFPEKILLKKSTLKIEVSKTLQGKIRKGYPWVFHYQVKNKNISGNAGDIAVIYDSDNRFLAAGLYDPFSDICFRALQTKTPRDIDEDFFRERFQNALTLRAELPNQKTTGYRVLNGENDGFPGLVADRYGDTAAVKVYTAAWFVHLDTLIPVIREELPVNRAVLLMSGHVQRTLPDSCGYGDGDILFGSPLEGSVRFLENGLSFEADVLQGQKTGFFLDQRENRQRIRELSKGRSVLNVFSYTGAFSVYAFAGGCRSVTEIEGNRLAIQSAQDNFKLNFTPGEIEAMDYQQIRGDAFKELAKMDEEAKTFDLVILDPPAFAKRKQHKQNAIQSYIRLVKAGAKRTAPGGILFAASCSALISASEFYRAVDLGIKSAGKSYQKLMKTGHSRDHPVSFREGAYLKAIYCEVHNAD